MEKIIKHNNDYITSAKRQSAINTILLWNKTVVEVFSSGNVRLGVSWGTWVSKDFKQQCNQLINNHYRKSNINYLRLVLKFESSWLGPTFLQRSTSNHTRMPFENNVLVYTSFVYINAFKVCLRNQMGTTRLVACHK